MTSTEAPNIGSHTAAPAMKTRALSDSANLTDKAIEFLSGHASQFPMTADEARCVIPYLRWVRFAEKSVVLRENDDTKTSYMLLILEGDVSVDLGTLGRADRVDISVLGPGSLIGEMALLDHAPRSANCTAITEVQTAGMSAGGLDLLFKESPSVAFKLLAYTARNTIDRLRSLSEQLHMVDKLNANLHQEIARLRQSLGKQAG